MSCAIFFDIFPWISRSSFWSPPPTGLRTAFSVSMTHPDMRLWLMEYINHHCLDWRRHQPIPWVFHMSHNQIKDDVNRKKPWLGTDILFITEFLFFLISLLTRTNIHSREFSRFFVKIRDLLRQIFYFFQFFRVAWAAMDDPFTQWRIKLFLKKS